MDMKRAKPVARAAVAGLAVLIVLLGIFGATYLPWSESDDRSPDEGSAQNPEQATSRSGDRYRSVSARPLAPESADGEEHVESEPSDSRWRAVEEDIDHLPAERTMLHDSMVDLDSIQGHLFGESFDPLLLALKEQSARQPAAAELTDVYRTALQAALSHQESDYLKDIACGLRLCMASVGYGSDSAPVIEGVEWWKFSEEASLPIYAHIAVDVPVNAGLAERRIVWSTDPTSSHAFSRRGRGN